jgi:hypothetical protein
MLCRILWQQDLENNRDLQYWNYIIQLYRGYLTSTECRRALSGDASGITRIHKFLEQWGIINFNIDPETCPYPARKFDLL